MNKWDGRWMRMAAEVATWSKDPSTQVGAIIANDKRLISIGYNGFPPRIQDTEARLSDRSIKYPRIIHAEANALLDAERYKIPGSSIFTYPFPPCDRCATLIIASGINRVVAPSVDDALKERWGDALKIAMELFEEAGVKVETI